MGRYVFVDPDVERLTLAGGEWVDVKQELSAGEQADLFGKIAKDYTAGEKLTLKPELVARSRLVAYLVGWSFTSREGRAIPVSAAAIYNLRQDVQAEIIAALDEHEAKQKALREDEAKNLVGASGSNPV